MPIERSGSPASAAPHSDGDVVLAAGERDGHDGENRPVIRGRHLRYLTVLILDRTRSEMTPSQLDRAIGMAGFRTLGPPGKAVSDSLRWACQHRHAVKVGHGRYVHGRITKQTRYRFRLRVADQAAGRPAT